MAAGKKGPTPRRRHDVETKLRADYLTLYEQLGEANRRAADAETRLALVERLLAAARPHVNERAFGTSPSPEALRVLRDIGDVMGRRAA